MAFAVLVAMATAGQSRWSAGVASVFLISSAVVVVDCGIVPTPSLFLALVRPEVSRFCAIQGWRGFSETIPSG